ncbi:unnamed protein product [Mortierella alpina]
MRFQPQHTTLAHAHTHTHTHTDAGNEQERTSLRHEVQATGVRRVMKHADQLLPQNTSSAPASGLQLDKLYRRNINRPTRALHLDTTPRLNRLLVHFFVADNRITEQCVHVQTRPNPTLCPPCFLYHIDWNEAEEEKDAQQWDDNWDDDDVEDDFSHQLRAEIQKSSAMKA